MAIKKFVNIFKDKKHCQRVVRELTILRKINHPSLIKIIDIIQPEDPENFTELCVVLEHADSDLRKIYHSKM